MYVLLRPPSLRRARLSSTGLTIFALVWHLRAVRLTLMLGHAGRRFQSEITVVTRVLLTRVYVSHGGFQIPTVERPVRTEMTLERFQISVTLLVASQIFFTSRPI